MLPEGIRAVVKKDSYEILDLQPDHKDWQRRRKEMMLNTFNMGIGMVLSV